ncbi:MAG: PEP-CTERM sorting domain-containing protein [Desulfuromonadales bacterium]|nr:PEP-CTERM sorting domain-containing protein [Desulfuromonadales bacterium]
MKKTLILLACAMFSMTMSAGIASAYSIDYQRQLLGNGGFTTNVTGALVETFDATSLNWNWSGDYKIRNTSSGISAQPYGLSGVDTTNFISVPNNSSSGSVTAVEAVNLGSLYNYFGLWWGSVDTYNKIEFYKNGSLVDSITGTQAISPSVANGNQTAPSTNLYVNIYGLKDFDSFKLISTNYAFEVDNIAVANIAPVPEPGTMMLLGVGMLGLAVFGKRRMNKEA